MKTQSSTNGIGFGAVLFLVFLVLKLTGYITWSWWWVTAPLWIPVVVALGIFAIAGMILAVVAAELGKGD